MEYCWMELCRWKMVFCRLDFCRVGSFDALRFGGYRFRAASLCSAISKSYQTVFLLRGLSSFAIESIAGRRPFRSPFALPSSNFVVFQHLVAPNLIVLSQTNSVELNGSAFNVDDGHRAPVDASVAPSASFSISDENDSSCCWLTVSGSVVVIVSTVRASANVFSRYGDCGQDQLLHLLRGRRRQSDRSVFGVRRLSIVLDREYTTGLKFQVRSKCRFFLPDPLKEIKM